MHNGSVKVESEEGRGTTFVVTIPIRFIEDNTLEISEEETLEEMPEVIEEETKEETIEEAQKIEEE